MDEKVDKGNLWVGLMIAGGVNLGALLVAVVTMAIGIGIVLVMGFGLLQFIWIGIMFSKYKAKGQIETGKGLLIGGGITLLLSAACWNAFSHTSFH